jgi:hypothetical protein
MSSPSPSWPPPAEPYDDGDLGEPARRVAHQRQQLTALDRKRQPGDACVGQAVLCPAGRVRAWADRISEAKRYPISGQFDQCSSLTAPRESTGRRSSTVAVPRGTEVVPRSRRTLSDSPPVPSAPVGSVRGDQTKSERTGRTARKKGSGPHVVTIAEGSELPLPAEIQDALGELVGQRGRACSRYRSASD